MAVKDILLDDSNDLIIQNGDFKVGESDPQHIQLIIESYIGSWKQFPLLGVGISFYKNSSGQSLALKRSIAIQLETDGYDKPDVRVNPGDIMDVSVITERSE